MKKMITMSLIAAATTVAFASTSDDIANLQSQIDSLKTKQGKINAQSANDNLKWGVDLRTSIDNINYDMADGSTHGKNDLMAMRLWLNMAYSPDSHNVFKGQLSMNKAFGADFVSENGRAFSMGGTFDWIANEALTDNSLKVRQAYWLYLGDKAFGMDIPWTFSIGRRPSTGGFLANLREDDAAQSPLGHIINVEFDGLSSKLDLSNVTGVPGMSIKLCMGQGSTNAVPMFESNGIPQYSNTDGIEDIKLGGFIFEPYNDGQFITKFTWFRAFDLPGQDLIANPGFGMVDHRPLVPGNMQQYGDMEGSAFSVLVDGLTEDGYLSDVKVFGSLAWSKSRPDAGQSMLGSTESETGTSYWFGAQLPVTEKGKFGIEYNHGSKYWRPFTYAEDTMVGSKLAARGNAFETYFTYQITDALSAQLRYTQIDYDYTGSNGFFGNVSGSVQKIDDVKRAAEAFNALSNADKGRIANDLNRAYRGLAPIGGTTQQEMKMAGAAGALPSIVEKAEDFRFYLRYRF